MSETILYLLAGLCLFVGAAECDMFENTSNGSTALQFALMLVSWPLIVTALLARRVWLWCKQ
jgi:hypothetical protein